MHRFLFASLFFLGVFLFFTADVKAYVTCQPIYGGGESCLQVGKIFINKTVQNPKTSEFVDSLSINDPKFSPGQEITFRIVITNNEDREIKNITVKDIFPQYITFVSGEGVFDANTKTVSIPVDSLKTSESKTFTVKAKAASDSQIPTAAGGVICMVNQAEATLGDKLSEDNAQFCIEKKVLGAVYPPQKAATTPATGSETIALLSLLPLGMAGLYLNYKTKLNS